MEDLNQQAIDLALAGKWKEAIEINLKILKTSSKDIDTLNRLGRSYLETGQKTKAQETYEKVLKIDKFNTIAIKNLDLLKLVRVRGEKPKTSYIANPAIFLEEPGVTRTISLTRSGDPKIVSRLRPGDKVKITCRGHAVVAVTEDGKYLGRLPDDLASRLREFLAGGSLYAAWIRGVDQQDIKIFVRETNRAHKYRNTPPFPLTEKLTYAAFTPPELIHEAKPDVSATGEHEDTDSLTSDQESELTNEEDATSSRS